MYKCHIFIFICICVYLLHCIRCKQHLICFIDSQNIITHLLLLLCIQIRRNGSLLGRQHLQPATRKSFVLLLNSNVLIQYDTFVHVIRWEKTGNGYAVIGTI